MGRTAAARAEDPFASADITLSGAGLLADPSGTLLWPDERMLLVADLHLEKGSAYARRGVLLPPYDTLTTLSRLARVVARYQPARVVALGDSLHDRFGSERLPAAGRTALEQLMQGRDWVWITGNHDPEISPSLGGTVAATLTVRGVTLRHDPTEGETPEIAGHLHPAARLVRRGTMVRRPCFVAGRNRLVLPAFGAYTGGMNVLSAPFRPHFPARSGLSVWMLGDGAVYPVPAASLAPDG